MSIKRTGKSAMQHSVETAGDLITSLAEGDAKLATRTLSQIKRQDSGQRVLAILAIIAAGALEDAYGKDWKEHARDFPEHLKEIA